MDDAVGVGVGHGLADLLKDGQEARQVVVGPRTLLKQLSKRLSLDQLHDEKRPAIVKAAHVVDRDDAGMLQLTEDLRLFQESRFEIGPAAVLSPQDLDR